MHPFEMNINNAEMIFHRCLIFWDWLKIIQNKQVPVKLTFVSKRQIYCDWKNLIESLWNDYCSSIVTRVCTDEPSVFWLVTSKLWKCTFRNNARKRNVSEQKKTKLNRWTFPKNEIESYLRSVFPRWLAL